MTVFARAPAGCVVSLANVKPSLGISRTPLPDATLISWTADQQQFQERRERESYLPLYDLLTQSGDVYRRVTHLSSDTLILRGKAAATGNNLRHRRPYVPYNLVRRVRLVGICFEGIRSMGNQCTKINADLNLNRETTLPIE